MDDTRTVILALVLPALLFPLVYVLAERYFSRSLASPYPKVEPRRRLLAAAVDGLLVVTTYALYRYSGVVWYLPVGALYLLARDAFGGQSVGKFVCSLVAINLETGRPATFGGSFRRNALLLLPGANVVAVALEARTIVRDPQGQRLGDRLAQTQVVDGFGARELLKAFQDWLMGLGAEFGRVTGRTDRNPASVDHRRRAA